ncbi:MAG: ribose transport system permease protein [Kiritimatiellia bacterium]|jgi:ribose transport system permease protein
MNDSNETKPTTTNYDRREIITGRTIGLIIATLVLFGAIALMSDTFLSGYTMFVLSRQVAFFALIALAQAVCLVVGGMNLAVGAMGSICTVTLGICLSNLGWSGWIAVPATLLVGALAGLFNGLLIVKLRINSFIVTLSTMFIFMGLRSGISGGNPYPVGDAFTFIGQKGLLGVPYIFIIMLLVLCGASFLYSHTVFGRRMLATGGNADAARLSGINNDNMEIGANLLSGLLAGLAAVLYASELGSAAPETGDAWLIVSFAVAIIGGTGLAGGAISPWGIFMGAIIYTLIRHGLIEMKANPYFMNVYIGVLILLTIAIDRVRELYGEKK